MYIFVDNNGRIIKKKTESYIEIKWIEEEISPNVILINNICPSIIINDNKLISILLPAYYHGDIYYAKYKDGYILSEDLFVLCKELNQVSINKEMMSYFHRKGYCPVGFTFFNEVKRLRNNRIYSFVDNELIDRLAEEEPSIGLLDDDTAYNQFKSILNTVINESIGENNSILMSGGVDSRLLFVLLKQKCSSVKVVSSLSSPYSIQNCKDVFLAEKMAELLGEKIHISTFDYATTNINKLNQIIRYMPLCSHISLNFLGMMNLLRQDENITAFSGQNMDALYNMGPTERFALNKHGIAQWFKRFYLSEEYFRTLNDVDGGALKARLISHCGKEMFKYATRCYDLVLPRTSKELINNFSKSADYTIFQRKSEATNLEDVQKVTPFFIKNELYKLKLSYLKGGDSQTIETSGFLNNIKTRLPYSDQRMVNFFSLLHLTSKDVWRPKRFSYRYIAEFTDKYGKDITNFKTPSQKEMTRRFGKALDAYEVSRKILNETDFGSLLVAGSAGKAEGYTESMKFSSLLNQFWLNTVIKLLTNEFNVKIIE